MRSFETLLRRPTLTLLGLLALGCVVFWPAIRSPFFLDDYLQHAMIRGTFPGPRGAADLYAFVDDENRAILVERGLIPWWSSPDLKIRFFRPLSSLLLYVDHKVMGPWPLGLHLHSVLWWLGSVLGARALFRRGFSPRVALMATAIFALAPCHAMPLAWVANRVALVSLAFGIAGLLAYTRFREDRALGAGLASGVLFLLALLGGGEYALSFGGYVLAYEVMRRGDSAFARLSRSLPFVLPAAAYLGARTALGYGTAGSGFYADPLHEPLTFLRKVPFRASSLWIEGWFTYDAAAWVGSRSRFLLILVAVASLGPLLYAIRRGLTALPNRERQTASWLVLGSALALVPILAVVPAMRLLGVASLGIAAAVALILEHAWFSDGAAPQPKPGWLGALPALMAITLGFSHLVHGPVTAWLMARHHRKDAEDFRQHATWLRNHLGDVPRAHVGIVRGMAGTFFTPFALTKDARPPARWITLAHSGHVLALRKGPRTLELLVGKDRSLYPAGDGNLFRSDRTPLIPGDEIVVSGMRAEILAVGWRGPRRVRFTFDEDPANLSWVTDGLDGWEKATLPEVGRGTPFNP